MQLDTSLAVSIASAAATVLTTYGVMKAKMDKFEKQGDDHDKKFDAVWLAVGDIRLSLSELKGIVTSLKNSELSDKLDRLNEKVQRVDGRVVEIAAVLTSRGLLSPQPSWRRHVAEPTYPGGSDTEPPGYERPRGQRGPRKPGGEEG